MFAALPGIREIRSALAGGYLWLLFLWLLLDPSFRKGEFEAEPWRSAHHLGEALGPVAIGVAATFGAYLLGTLVNEVRGVMSQVYLRARQSADGYSPGPSPEALERVRENREVTRERIGGQWSMVMRILFPGREREGGLRRGSDWEDDRLEKVLAGFGRGFAALPALFLVTAKAVGFSLQTLLRVGNWLTGIIEEVVLRGVGGVIAVRIKPYAPFLSEPGVATIEGYLERNLPAAGENKPDVASVIADFPVLRTRLLGESIDTVNEVDRLRAEADFRAAIVPPLLALAGVLVFEVSAWWLFAVPPLLALLATARLRKREAGDLLADVVGRGVVVPPSVEAYLAAG